jgi:tetratricopeptide (TPR) repeat protein
VRNAAIASDRAAALFAELPLKEWPAYLRDHRELFTIPVLEYVLDEAKLALDDTPEDTLALTSFLVARLGRVPRAPNFGTDRTFRGRVLKEHAGALATNGNLPRARRVLARAYALLNGVAGAGLQLAASHLLDAFLRHLGGETDTALALIRRASHMSAQHNDERGISYARLLEGWIAFTRNDYIVAEEQFACALEIATALDDVRTMARAYANLGNCAVERGEDAQAFEYFARATPLYARLSMNAERQRILWGIGRVALKRGHLDDALSVLGSVQQDFLRRGQIIAAALAKLDALDLLVMLGRQDEVRAQCQELTTTFAAAGMPAQARRAFTTLQRRATRGTVQLDMIAKARAPLINREAA